MSNHEREFLDALRTQSVKAAAEILEGVDRLKSMYDEVTDDGSGAPLPRPRIADHFYQLAKFELEHASRLIQLGNSQAELVFEHLRGLARRAQKTSSPVLSLTPDAPKPGVSSATSRAHFEVRNPFDRKAHLRFKLAPLKTNDGSDAEGTLKAWGAGKRDYVEARGSIRIEVVAEPSPAHRDETLFSELTVYLSADVDKQVAHRILKVCAADREAPRP